MNVSRFYTLAVLLAVTLCGCVAIQPFPQVARSGDTITLAIGSLDGASKKNLTVLFTPDGGNPIDLSQHIRSVFRIYPDPTSPVYLDSAGQENNAYPPYIAMVSGHGPWQTVVALDLVGVPEGPGTISILLGQGIVVPNIATSPADIAYDLTIIAGTGGPSVFEFATNPTKLNTIGDLERLSQSRQAIVRTVPHGGTYDTTTDIGAAEYVLFVPIVDEIGNVVTGSVSDDRVRVVLDMQPDYMKGQVGLIWKRTGPFIKVLITSPLGRLWPERLRFSVVVMDYDGDQSVHTIADNAAIVSAKIFNIDGSLAGNITQELVIQGGNIPKSIN